MKITPELMVKDFATSLAFYRDVLGFNVTLIYPEDNPIFAQVTYEGVDIMLYGEQSFRGEMPHLDQMIGSTMALFIDITNIESWLQKVTNHTKIVTPLHDTVYHTREFACLDPNGYTLIFAENK